jgi:CheY-like chemotaxis protein
MDDEDMIGEIICQMLEHFGFDTVRVTDGVDALREFKKHNDDGVPFAAVILDLNIPNGMGGKEAIAEILNVDRKAQVFVSSGSCNDPAVVNFQDHGFAGVIAKPFDLASMQRTLAPLL